MVDANIIGGSSIVCSVDHGADSGVFTPIGLFAIIAKINARVGRFDERLGDDMFMAVIDVATVIPPLFCELYCKHKTVYDISLSSISRLPEASVS